MEYVDALIISPSARANVYQGLGKSLAAIEPPIWAALIANHLRNKKLSVGLIDADGAALGADECVRVAADYDPRLTVVVVYGQQPSASTQNMHAAGIFVRRYKEVYPERKVLMLGGHVSALPKRTLEEEAADFVCKGEGPHTITALLQTDLKSADQLSKVPGLWFREGKEVRAALPGILIAQKDLTRELPGMAWDLLPMSNYMAHNWHCFDHIHDRKPYASLYTSLGCPFKCSFCCINAPFEGSGFRYWDPECMVREFDTLALKYNVKNIKIADEMFVLNTNHFLKLCELLIQRQHGFNIWAYARVDTVKPQWLAKLKAAGVHWLALGIESGSKHVRDGVTKGRFGQQDIRHIVQQIKDAGIHVIGNYIFGLPDDDYESMQATLDLSLELNCEMSNYYSAMAYPGSALYPLALQQGWSLPTSWLGFSQHAFETLPLPTEKLTAGEVLAFRDYAFDVYFSSPTFLKLVKSKFGEETLRHIMDMAAHRLDRRYAISRDELVQRLHSPARIHRGTPSIKRVERI